MVSTLMDSMTAASIAQHALKGVALLLAVWLLTVALRKASAAWRHALWLAGLGALVALPWASTLVPSVNVPLAWASKPAPAPAPAGPKAPMPATVTRDFDFGEPHLTAVESHVSMSAGIAPVQPVAMTPAPVMHENVEVAAATTPGTMPSWPRLLAGIWMLAALALITPYLVGRAMLWRLRRASRPVDDAGWQQMVQDACTRMGIQRRVRILISPRALVPMTWGVLRPVVLLPHTAQTWDDTRRRMVIAHELAHVRRYDCLSDSFARVVRALHWFNPLVWLALRRLCAEREAACDSWVLRCGYAPSAYAATLVDIARGTRHPRLLQAAGLAMARSSKVARRVNQILQPAAAAPGPMRSRVAAVLAFVCVFGGLAGVRVSGAEPPVAPAVVHATFPQKVARLGAAETPAKPRLHILIVPRDGEETFPQLTLNNVPYDVLRASGIDAATFQVKDGTVSGLELDSKDTLTQLLKSAVEALDGATIAVASDAPIRAVMDVMDTLKAAGIERIWLSPGAYPGTAVVSGSVSSGAFPGQPAFGGGMGGSVNPTPPASSGFGGGGGVVMRSPGAQFTPGLPMSGRRVAPPSGDPSQTGPTPNSASLGNRVMQFGRDAISAAAEALDDAWNGSDDQQQRAHVQNLLKQVGLVFKMAANDSAGNWFPSLADTPGALQPRIDEIYPEYADDTIRDFVSNQTEDIIVYTGYTVQSDADGLAFLEAYRKGTLGETVDVGEGRQLHKLREGVERFYITDIGNPAAAALAQSQIPVMWTMPGTAGGGNVLFMDGHVEYIEYPGKFPMTVEFIEGLRDFMRGSQAAHTGPMADEILQEAHNVEFHTSSYMGNTLTHARFYVAEDDLADLIARLETKGDFTRDPKVDHAFGPESAKTYTNDGALIAISWWTPQHCDAAMDFFWTAIRELHWLRVCPAENGEHLVFWRTEST